MEFRWSAETDWRVSQAELRRIANGSINLLKAMADETALRDVDLTVAYIPIIMIDSAKGSYPSRTRKLTKQRVAQCAPQLDHNRFVNGNGEDRIELFYQGLLDAVKPLESFGLSPEEIASYIGVVERAKGAAMRAEREKTTHKRTSS